MPYIFVSSRFLPQNSQFSPYKIFKLNSLTGKHFFFKRAFAIAKYRVLSVHSFLMTVKSTVCNLAVLLLFAHIAATDSAVTAVLVAACRSA